MANAADAEVDFSAEGVRNFIIKHGGKVSNVAVVGHFMAYLRHPDKEVREDNRRKFKEFMNEVAVVKKDDKDDKIVVLKRKKKDINYGDFVELPKLVVFQDQDPSQPPAADSEATPVPPMRRPKRPKSDTERTREEKDEPVANVTGPSVEDDGKEYTGPKEQEDVIRMKEGERIIDQKRQIQSVKSFADIFDQEVQSQKEEVERFKSPSKTAPKNSEAGTNSELEAEAARQDEALKDDEPAPLISLDPLEHQWMMESAKANLVALSNLLKQDITLAGKKDFVTTALHWGAKHGKKEMIRLVADRGADVNSRSQGGYTPLHIAAIHNKESVMQFLIQDYHADINIRDFSGRKARHYLKTGASSYMQQMLTGTPTTSPPRIRLMALAEDSPPEKHHHHHHHSHSMFHSFRDTIRNSFRLWGSAENLDEPDSRRPHSAKNHRPGGVDYLMPPPAAQPKNRRHTDTTPPYSARKVYLPIPLPATFVIQFEDNRGYAYDVTHSKNALIEVKM